MKNITKSEQLAINAAMGTGAVVGGATACAVLVALSPAILLGNCVEFMAGSKRCERSVLGSPVQADSTPDPLVELVREIVSQMGASARSAAAKAKENVKFAR